MSSRVNFKKTGMFTGAGADRKVVLGFQPVKVELINVTDFVKFTKTSTMSAGLALKEVAAGTMTYPAAQIEIVSDGFIVKAAVAIAAKEFHYTADEATNE